MLSSWPALSTAFDRDWVIRLADGVTKRSNSVTCLGTDARLGPGDSDLDRRIERIEEVYAERDLPAIFRLSPLASPALDARLADRGWRRFDETVVMTADLDAIQAKLDGGPQHDVAIATEPDRRWLQSCYRIDETKPDHLQTLATMLDRLIPKAGYGRIGEAGRIDALALVVIDAELAGLFEVLTSPERRREGLAQALLRALFAWSRSEGATTAWLAAVADSQPALSLYERLGFREVYRYHYRSNG